VTSPYQAAEPQDAVIDFLSCPASYGLRDGAVDRIETHCSIVFLAADRAYKLKRAIRYASLDYTTNALRRRACESEFLLNRRTAPEIYLATGCGFLKAGEFGCKAPRSFDSGDRRKDAPRKNCPIRANPNYEEIALPVSTFGHSGLPAIGLTPNSARQQKSQDRSGLQPNSPAFKNPQPVETKG